MANNRSDVQSYNDNRIVSVLASYVNLAADHDFHDEDSLVFGYASAMADRKSVV